MSSRSVSYVVYDANCSFCYSTAANAAVCSCACCGGLHLSFFVDS